MGIGEGQNRSEPEIIDAIERVKVAADGKRLGIHATVPQYAASMANDGFHLVTVTSDLGSLNGGASEDIRLFRRGT